MGLMKEIQAKRAEMEANKACYSAFLDSAVEIERQVKKIASDLEKMDEIRENIAARVSKLDTRGEKALEDYKKNLQGLSTDSSKQIAELNKLFRILPLTPVQRLVSSQESEIHKLTMAFVDKHSASFPKEIKLKMTFKGPKGEIIEITTVDNPAVYHCKEFRDGKEKNGMVNKGILNVHGGYKYLRG